MLKSYQHKPKEKISWFRPWNRHTRPTQIDQMCCQLWGWIDLLLHFLCLLLSLIKVNLQRREGKIDLFHVALLSFLFWDLPGLWPLTKNCIYWIYSGWLLFKLKKVIINCLWEMQQCVCCKDVAATMIQWFTHCSFQSLAVLVTHVHWCLFQDTAHYRMTSSQDEPDPLPSVCFGSICKPWL